MLRLCLIIVVRLSCYTHCKCCPVQTQPALSGSGVCVCAAHISCLLAGLVLVLHTCSLDNKDLLLASQLANNSEAQSLRFSVACHSGLPTVNGKEPLAGDANVMLAGATAGMLSPSQMHPTGCTTVDEHCCGMIIKLFKSLAIVDHKLRRCMRPDDSLSAFVASLRPACHC